MREKERGQRAKTHLFPLFFCIESFSINPNTAEKSFETLRDEPDAPQLPASYPVMMVTAVAFPALFRRVMEPRARAVAPGSGIPHRRRTSARRCSSARRNG